MNELYEFMKQVDVIVLFCLIYGFAINGIVSAICAVIRFTVKKVEAFRRNRRQKTAQNEDMTE